MPDRLTADEVLRRYTNGERDFRNVNLRGVSFAKAVKRAKRDGQAVDLSGADFSGAQIQGTNFAGVKLQEANFTGARAGLRKRRVLIQLILALLISIVFSSLGLIFSTALIGTFFYTSMTAEVDSLSGSSGGDYTFGSALLLFQLYTWWIFARQGYTVAALRSLLFIVIVAVITAIAVASAGLGIDVGIAAVVAAVVGVFTSTVAVGAAFAVASAGTFAVIVALSTVVMYSIFAAELVITGTVSDTEIITSLITLVVGLLSPIFSTYTFWQAINGDVRFFVVRASVVAFGSWGGTRFYQADLTEATFTKAVLKNTNFYQANLTRTCFRGAEKLTRARPGDSILQNWDVLQLLINGRAQGKDFTGANLRGAYLAGAELAGANLTRADLSEATLENAELVKANLKEAAAIGTNFTKAHLTGACLEAWNIDSSTILKDVDCQFVFLLEQPNEFGHRERRPHDSNKIFDKGKFEQFFKEVLDEVQILIKNGIQPDAFRAAMQRLMEEHNITTEDITAYQRKGNDVQVSFKVPPGTDKGAVEQTWDDGYQAGIAAVAGQLKLEQKRADDNKEFALETIRNIGNLTFNVTAMNQSNTPNITASGGSFVNTGDMQNNVVNLREVSGNVTNAINQLPDQSPSDQPSLKDVLTELQAAIEAEPELSTDDKAEALEQVKTLAEAGQKPEDSRLQKAAKTAMKILRGTTAGISETTKLAEAAAKLLPAITAILTFL